MPCASFSMLDSHGGTGCDEVHFLAHGCQGSRDVGVFDCVKECMRLVRYLIIYYVGWGLFMVFVISYCSVVFSLGPVGSICKISNLFQCVSAFISSVYRVLKDLPVWSIQNLEQSLNLSLYTPVDVCFLCLVLCVVSLEGVVCSVCYVVFQIFQLFFVWICCDGLVL